MDQLVRIAKALADATRVRILAALRGGELCVCELGGALGVTQSTLSTHLQVIRAAGWVHTRRKGKWIYYSLEPASAGLLEVVFSHFRDDLAKHRLLRRDTARLGRKVIRGSANNCRLATAHKKSKPSQPTRAARAVAIPARRHPKDSP